MKVNKLHSWDVDREKAKELQIRFREKLKFESLEKSPELIAGADMSHKRNSDTLYSAVVVLNYETLETVDSAKARMKVNYPYIPGYLSFREGPVVLEAFRRLEIEPDAIIFDGQGYAHPERMGLASHLGLFLEKPSVGCAKSVLTGEYESLSPERGDSSPLMDSEEKIGLMVRTRTDVKPVVVSPGHLVDFEGSKRIVLECSDGYKLPEPVRQAHLLVNRFRRENEKKNL